MGEALQLARHTAEALNDASQIGLNNALTATYWRIGSLKIKEVSKYPGLAFVGPSGSGKSTNMGALKQMDIASSVTVSCIRLSTAEARDQLAGARDLTVFCEEFDQLSDPKSAYILFHSRSDRDLSKLAVKIQSATNGPYHSETVDVFGATVVHSRNSFDDPALGSRFITLPTRHQKGPFTPYRNVGDVREIAKSLVLQDQPPGEGRIHDTWWPVLCVAAQLDDNQWLEWASGQIKMEQEALLEAAEYDRKSVILGRIIEVVWSRSQHEVDPWFRINIHSEISEYLRVRGYPDITPWQVNSELNSLGLKTIRSGGRRWLFPTPLRLILACQKSGYEDEWIEELKGTLELH